MELEVELDKFLKIKTNGRDDSNSNFTNYPYEATPYKVLQNLGNSGYITKRDVIIDYGCGKGRVDFYLAYMTKSKMIGIEYDERLFNSAMENHKKAISASRVSFVNTCASLYQVPEYVTAVYFFNPFSTTILKEVLNNIRISKELNNREIKLFFYYPSKEYLNFLEKNPDIIYIDSIDCTELYKEYDKREYIAVYKI
jgi:hypothetical protein